jgi:hypothetical protein
MAIINFTEKNFTAAPFEFVDVPVPVGATMIILRINRTQWTNKNQIVLVQLWLSLNGGVDYYPAGSATAEGGIVLDRQGVPMTVWPSAWTLADPDNPNRMVAAHILSARNNVRLSGSVELL